VRIVVGGCLEGVEENSGPFKLRVLRKVMLLVDGKMVGRRKWVENYLEEVRGREG